MNFFKKLKAFFCCSAVDNADHRKQRGRTAPNRALSEVEEAMSELEEKMSEIKPIEVKPKAKRKPRAKKPTVKNDNN